MSERKVAAYGAWASPITIDLLLSGAVGLKWGMPRWDGDDLYWTELRPTEAGRQVIVRRGAGGAIIDVTPAGYNARRAVACRELRRPADLPPGSGRRPDADHACRGHPPRGSARRRRARKDLC